MWKIRSYQNDYFHHNALHKNDRYYHPVNSYIVENDFSICFLSDIAASDLPIQFKITKRGFLLKPLSRTIIFQRGSRSVKGVYSVLKICIYLRNCYVQAKKECQKLTMKDVLNDQKYHEILQNSKILHTQSKLQGGIFN